MSSSSIRHAPPPEVGPILRRARRARGLSLRQAARKYGTTYGYVGMLERGERSPSRTMARLLVEALGLAGETAATVMRSGVPGAGRDYPR